ncbi:hypothetical protein BGZ98_002578 [Dissophora globulifera]|nr:hypothetical protein BGZ98_002578 [Dissophora globulifera]
MDTSAMGEYVTNWISPEKEIRVLVLGLEGAGKTTILHKLKAGEIVTTIPTPGFSVETVECRNLRFTSWDVGGQNKNRSLWSRSRDELSRLFNEDELREAIFLIIANKQDLPNARTLAEIVDQLELQSHNDHRRNVVGQLGSLRHSPHPWHIHAISATSGQGLDEGMNWIMKVLLG